MSLDREAGIRQRYWGIGLAAQESCRAAARPRASGRQVSSRLEMSHCLRNNARAAAVLHGC